MNWTNRRHLFFWALLLIVFNEFTLQFFDKNPPISDSMLLKIRAFDVGIFLIACTANLLVQSIAYLQAASRFFILYVMPTVLAIILLDVSLGVIGFGYPSHYEQENIERFPNPSDTFRGKPNARDHNEFGFRGKFSGSSESYNVAIFGGSTTYNGDPPIIEMVRNIITDEGINIEVFNFGSVSSNHTQHVHRLLEFSDRFRFDLVIFYGGGNETLQYASYDPRPGHPYNFFFRYELNPLMQSVLRYSSILGTVDQFTGGSLSGLKAIKSATLDSNWSVDVVENYWRDLNLANNLVSELVEPNVCSSPTFLSITQPGNPGTQLSSLVWDQLIESVGRFNGSWRHMDFSIMAPNVDFTDSIHLTQKSRAVIANKIAKIVGEVYREAGCGTETINSTNMR